MECGHCTDVQNASSQEAVSDQVTCLPPRVGQDIRSIFTALPQNRGVGIFTPLLMLNGSRLTVSTQWLASPRLQHSPRMSVSHLKWEFGLLSDREPRTSLLGEFRPHNVSGACWRSVVTEPSGYSWGGFGDRLFSLEFAETVRILVIVRRRPFEKAWSLRGTLLTVGRPEDWRRSETTFHTGCFQSATVNKLLYLRMRFHPKGRVKGKVVREGPKLQAFGVTSRGISRETPSTTEMFQVARRRLLVVSLAHAGFKMAAHCRPLAGPSAGSRL